MPCPTASTGSCIPPGVAGGGPVHLLPRAEWDRVIGINLTATFLVAKAAVARMIEQPRVDGERGSIVTLASIEGLEGTAGGSSYNAAKGGVVLLTKNIALDYGPSGIRANAICPGFIETPMAQGVFSMPGMEGPLASITKEHALQRLGQPEEIAAVAAFLLSSRRFLRHRSGDCRRRWLHGRPRSWRGCALRVPRITT